jgi:hypothetical protein
LYKLYVAKDGMGVVSRTEKSEAQQEYNRQRGHLEKNVEALKSRIAKELRIFEADHRQLVHDNVLLTEEINALRREEKRLCVQQQMLERAANTFLNPRARQSFFATSEMASSGRFGSRNSKRGGSGGSHPSTGTPSARRPDAVVAAAAQKEVEMQRQQIEQLESQIRRLQDVLDVPLVERIRQLEE